MANSQRLYILNNQDFSATYEIPKFNELERRHFFVLSEPELKIVKLRIFNGRETSSKLYFILQLGYFKAKHLFFRFQYIEVEDDIRFILHTHLPNIQIVQCYLTHKTEQTLQQIFAIEDVFYKITELKFDAKSFRHQEMQGELDKLKTCSEIYRFSNIILPYIDISRKNIDYYAGLAKTYTVYRLKRLPKALAYFYVTCYVYDRYEKIVNNLIKGFVYYVDKYNADAKKYANNNKPDLNAQLYENKKSIGELIGFSFLAWKVMNLRISMWSMGIKWVSSG